MKILAFFDPETLKTLNPYWIRIGIQPKVLDPDPKHCRKKGTG
jgi:hypothetical protein